jgi:hypothetical protein
VFLAELRAVGSGFRGLVCAPFGVLAAFIGPACIGGRRLVGADIGMRRAEGKALLGSLQLGWRAGIRVGLAPADAILGIVDLIGSARRLVVAAELCALLVLVGDARRASHGVVLAPCSAILGMVHHLVGAGLRVLGAELCALGVFVGDLIGARLGVVGTELGALFRAFGGASGAQIGVLLAPVLPDSCGWRRVVRSRGEILGKSKRRHQAHQSARGENDEYTETHVE